MTKKNGFLNGWGFPDNVKSRGQGPTNDVCHIEKRRFLQRVGNDTSQIPKLLLYILNYRFCRGLKDNFCIFIINHSAEEGYQSCINLFYLLPLHLVCHHPHLNFLA